MAQQRIEVVEGSTLGRLSQRAHLLIGQRLGRLGQAAVPIVRPIDPDRAEPRGKSLDLAKEVVSGEPVLAEPVRQRVGRGREPHATLVESREQGGHEHRVAGVIEFELVDAEQPHTAERLDGGTESQRTDEVGQFDKGRVGLGTGHGVPQRCEQVSLADTEPTIEVDTAGSARSSLALALEPTAGIGATRAYRLSELAQRS